MMRLGFLGKVAFICNLFFIAAFILRYKLYSTQVDITSHIILAGWLLSPFFNGCFLAAWAWKARKSITRDFPVWLGVANALFLLLQILSYFILR